MPKIFIIYCKWQLIKKKVCGSSSRLWSLSCSNSRKLESTSKLTFSVETLIDLFLPIFTQNRVGRKRIYRKCFNYANDRAGQWVGIIKLVQSLSGRCNSTTILSFHKPITKLTDTNNWNLIISADCCCQEENKSFCKLLHHSLAALVVVKWVCWDVNPE